MKACARFTLARHHRDAGDQAYPLELPEACPVLLDPPFDDLSDLDLDWLLEELPKNFQLHLNLALTVDTKYAVSRVVIMCNGHLLSELSAQALLHRPAELSYAVRGHVRLPRG